MKKIISLAMTALLLAAVSIPSFAAPTKQSIKAPAPKSGDVMVKTDDTKDTDGKDPAGFCVTIPADTAIAWGTTDAVNLEYTVESHLRRGQGVKVEVTSAGAMKTDAAKGEVFSIPYALSGDKSYAAASPVVYPAQTKTLSVTVQKADWEKAVVETYSDTLTFSITVA